MIRAFSELDSVSQLWTTGYGDALIVKTALLAVLVDDRLDQPLPA